MVIAPGYAPGVCALMHARRASTRLLEAPAGAVSGTSAGAVSDLQASWELRQLGDEFLLQDIDRCGEIDDSAWRVVTARHPTPDERVDAVFAWQVCAATASNAVVLARNRVAWGIGAGQQNRAEAGRLAAAKAAGRAEGGVCASDGFYPFVDGVGSCCLCWRCCRGAAWRFDQRRQSDSSRRRLRSGHAVHRPSPIPPLAPAVLQVSEVTAGSLRVRLSSEGPWHSAVALTVCVSVVGRHVSPAEMSAFRSSNGCAAAMPFSLERLLRGLWSTGLCARGRQRDGKGVRRMLLYRPLRAGAAEFCSGT